VGKPSTAEQPDTFVTEIKNLIKMLKRELPTVKDNEILQAVESIVRLTY